MVRVKLTVKKECPSHESTAAVYYMIITAYIIVIVEEENSNERGRVYLDHRVSHYIALWKISIYYTKG